SPRLLFKTSYRSPLLFYNYSSTTNIYTLSLHDALPIYLTFESYMTLKLDRILDWKVSTEKKPQISYGEKFRDGEVRNKRVDPFIDRKSTRLNSSHVSISYALFCLKKKKASKTDRSTVIY